MQVKPIKSPLKSPGTMRLKLKGEESVSKCAFKFKLRRCIERKGSSSTFYFSTSCGKWQGLTFVRFSAQPKPFMTQKTP